MKVLVTGVAGQDGTYLKALLEPNHDVLGIDRRGVSGVKCDITDSVSVQRVVQDFRPDWVFNLAAQTFVGDSWAAPRLHMETNYGGVLNVLEAVRQYAPKAHVVQASTSEMFGDGHNSPMNEETPFCPASPYAVAKLAAHHLCRVYRESYGMHVSCAISFNHESPIRPVQFVTRKITQAAARGGTVTLGNIDAVRDWGFAGDYVKAYVRMAEMLHPDDYVIGTGKPHSVADVCRVAFGSDWGLRVSVADSERRPNDVNWLCADATKARTLLGWEPETTFHELIEMMVDADREKVAV